jgi:hypothetical protein
VDEAAAQEIVSAYEDAARSRCSPQPVVSAQRYAMGPALAGDVELRREVVAVNVLPFPGQPIGVRIQADPPAYIFPVRVSTRTIFLTPEQLSMLMTAEIRRIAILIATIPVDAQCSIRLYTGTNKTPRYLATFEGHDPFANAVFFRSLKKGKEVTHPLDQVQTVFFDRATKKWDIAIRRYA